MKKITFIITAFLLTTLCFGQKGKIIAKLVDAESGKPVATAVVILFGTTTGAMTNQDGYFQLDKIPAKQSEIIISDQNNVYMELIVTNIELTKEKEIDLGTISLNKKTDRVELLSEQCLTIGGKTYKAKFIDGDYRYIEGTISILYLDQPVACD